VDSSRSALASQVEFQHPQSKLIPRISAGMASPSVLAMDSIAQTPHQTAISTSRNPARFQGLGIAVENGGPLRNIGDRVEADSGIQGVNLRSQSASLFGSGGPERVENHAVSRFVSHIVDSLSSSTHFQMLDPAPGYISTRRSV
jgi:hypothetical protein